MWLYFIARTYIKTKPTDVNYFFDITSDGSAVLENRNSLLYTPPLLTHLFYKIADSYFLRDCPEGG